MKKLFISADIEGTCGICHWDETEKGSGDYAYFAAQMTREVTAACEAAGEAGFDYVLVKDAHDSGRNIDPSKLPEYAEIFRGWARHPYSMMYGLDGTFDGVVITGYHSAASWPTNPLSHTMNSQNNHVILNGQTMSELMMNSLTAASLGVPVYAVTGDKGLCDWIKTVNPNIMTVPVNEGVGAGARSIHPALAVKRIGEAVKAAVKQDRDACMFPLPEHFHAEINFKEHMRALGGSWYPGARQLDSRTVAFDSDSWMDVLTFFHFVL